MSYEGDMLIKLAMPPKKAVEEALLKTLVKHNGSIKEFAEGEKIVEEIANQFSLKEEQRTAVLERIYKKENRVVKTPLWHRLLYRAADSLAKNNLITNPSTTFHLINKKEWMLTEDGYDKALFLMKIPSNQKELLQVKSYEVQSIANKIIKGKRPDNYNPIDIHRKKKTLTKEQSIRVRGFRQAVIESYDCKCCICGLKIKSPNNLYWEVEAAHIVPHSLLGKNDIWNGLALCSLHHWAFDVGWITLSDDFKMMISSKYDDIENDYGKMGNFDILKNGVFENKPILLPEIESLFPHKNSIMWHRENIFFK